MTNQEKIKIIDTVLAETESLIVQMKAAEFANQSAEKPNTNAQAAEFKGRIIEFEQFKAMLKKVKVDYVLNPEADIVIPLPPNNPNITMDTKK